MTFTSFEYAILLLSTFSVYHFLPWRARIVLLVVASYVFYAYWRPFYAYIIGATTFMDYLMGVAMGSTDSPRARRSFLLASVVGNLGTLGFFKYTNFGLDVLRPLLARAGVAAPALEIALPVGISFYTFQEMSYTIDVYRRRVAPTRDLLLFAAYVSFFPQLVAGPIERAGSLLEQLGRKQPFRFQQACDGVGLILVGLAKKLVLADRLTYFSMPKFHQPAAFDGLQLLLAVVAMPFALYLDFGAYTDIARGSGKLFGIELTRNFNFPFAVFNPAEYWNRWHISLTSWVRDYVFAPLGGVARRSALRTIFNTTAAMTLMGLWHGAAWRFVLWGAGNGLVLSAYYVWRLHVPVGRRTRPTVLGLAAGWAATTACEMLLGVLFFAPDLATVALCWKRLFTAPWTSWLDPATGPLAAFCLAFWAVQFAGRTLDWRGAWDRLPAPVRGLAFATLVYVVLFGSVPVVEQFIYFQF